MLRDSPTDAMNGACAEAVTLPEDVAQAVAAAPQARQPVLIVLHQRQSQPGHVGRWLRMHGFPLDVRRPACGDALPNTLAGHAGAVIFGGPQSANDACDFIRAEIDWLKVPLQENKPFLGICLGAQMLALHLGAKVAFHPDARAEIGYYPIAPTQAGAALFDWPATVYQWHREGFEVPRTGTLLAEGEHFPNQAFRYGEKAYALQFHPEISYHLVHRWSTHASHRLVLPGARPREEHVRGHIAHGPRARRWLGDFMCAWTGTRASRADWR